MGGSDGRGTGVVRGGASEGKGKVKGSVVKVGGLKIDGNLGKCPVLLKSSPNSRLDN